MRSESDEVSGQMGDAFILLEGDVMSMLECDKCGQPYGFGCICGEKQELTRDQQIEELQRQNAFLVEQLNDASESVQEWGNYADQYFQDKWNLSGDVQKYKDAANAASTQSAAWLEASHIEWMTGLPVAGYVRRYALEWLDKTSSSHTVIDNAFQADDDIRLYAIPNKKE